jgi:hypothetical protein
MGKVVDFLDGRWGCWASIKLANGDPVHISVAQTGVVVKRSKAGILGAKLFEERNAYRAAMTAKELHFQAGSYSTPPGMQNAVLKAFTQAALGCGSTAEVAVRLNEALNLAMALEGAKADLIAARRDAAAPGGGG